MKHWEITDTGLIRHENQDAFGFAQLPGGYAVAVVCDGMGGVAGGSIASTVAVETFIRTLTETGHSGHLDRAVQEAVTAANAAIRQRAAGHPELKSMGTTLVSALVKGDKVLISNVGDSRAYLAGADGLRQISRDHSLVEDMVEKGDLTPGQARSHPRRNLITRALGPDPAVEADGFPLQWKPGDFLLLCSDGLTNAVPRPQLEQLLRTGSFYDLPDLLIRAANENGGKDNITALLLGVEPLEVHHG